MVGLGGEEMILLSSCFLLHVIIFSPSYLVRCSFILSFGAETRFLVTFSVASTSRTAKITAELKIFPCRNSLLFLKLCVTGCGQISVATKLAYKSTFHSSCIKLILSLQLA